MYRLDRQRGKMDRHTDKQAEWHADRKERTKARHTQQIQNNRAKPHYKETETDRQRQKTRETIY